jgi:hypothetical protein
LADEDGTTLLLLAIEKNSEEIFDALIQHAKSRITNEAINSWIN